MLWIRIALLTLQKKLILASNRHRIKETEIQTCLLKKRNPPNAGFTLTELLIVMTLMAFLLAFSAPWVTSVRSEIAMQKTIRQIKSDFISTLTYALAGKSFGLSLNHQGFQNQKLPPSAYLLSFSLHEDNSSYSYLELSSLEDINESLSPIFKIDHLYPTSEVFLKEISLFDAKKQTEIPVNSAYIFVLPPFGKVFLINGDDDLNQLQWDEISEKKSDYERITLTFQYKDKALDSQSISLTTNKLIDIF